MVHDNWSRTITITREDLEVGNWESRDRNPIALALARVLRPGATLFVDVEEYFISYGTHSEWFCLPDILVEYASRVYHGGPSGEMTIQMSFPPWAIVTERSVRKRYRDTTDLDDVSDSINPQ